MPEIKSQVSEETLTQYARDNNLDVLNLWQIIAKFYELEQRIQELELY